MVRSFGAGPPVVALHGFTHTGRQFEEISRSVDRRFVAPDLPGHGMHAATPCDIDTVINGVADTIIEHADPPATVLGYSQGGRIALLVGLARPDLVSAMVLISATPGIADPSERALRAESDRELADTIMRVGIDAFLDDWTTRPMTSTEHIGHDRRSADRAVRAANTHEGLAGALRGYGQGAQPPAWDDLALVQCPTLLISGERDEKYTVIGATMAERMANAETAVIPGAGHNPLLDAPEAVGAEISRFLDRFG